MNDILQEYVFTNFNHYFPAIAKKLESYWYVGEYTINIRLNDGSHICYDDVSKTIRSLPHDDMEMSEEECRREFGEGLRIVLREKNMTVLELANITGIPEATLSRYINGRMTPTFSKVDKIAKALNCSMERFRYRIIHKE